jgi:hypothetical protein
LLVLLVEVELLDFAGVAAVAVVDLGRGIREGEVVLAGIGILDADYSEEDFTKQEEAIIRHR